MDWNQLPFAIALKLFQLCSHGQKLMGLTEVRRERSCTWTKHVGFTSLPGFDVGYQLLMRLAPYERNYLLPSPGPNYGGIRQAELSYDGALAALRRLLRTLQSEDKELLIPQLCSYWTPHSPRSILPTCCTALGVSKPERDVLGRWAKQGSDRYVRISRMIIQRLQLLAAHTLRGRPDAAALIGEAESLSELQEFLRERGLPQDQIDHQAWRLNSELSRKFSVQVKPKHDLFTPIEEQERMLREEVLFHQSEVVDESTGAEPKRAPGRAPCPTIKEQRVQTLQELPKGFLRLHSRTSEDQAVASPSLVLDGSGCGLFCLQLCRQIHAASNRL